MKTGNLMAAFACVLCLGLGAYENFDAAYKDAQRLQKENKDTEALTALQKAAALSQEDWQRYRVFPRRQTFISKPGNWRMPQSRSP